MQLTAFIYVCRDVDGGGVVRDEPLEVGVDLKIIGKISVFPSFDFLCLIKLQKRGQKQQKLEFQYHPGSEFMDEEGCAPSVCEHTVYAVYFLL